MNHEMTILPYGWKQDPFEPRSTELLADEVEDCYVCGRQTEFVSFFVNMPQQVSHHTEYESKLSICTSCAMPHLQLLTSSVDFTEPIIIGWN